jgi:hypothetical protein
MIRAHASSNALPAAQVGRAATPAAAPAGRTGALADATAAFLNAKLRTLTARAGRLAELTPDLVGLDADDLGYAPSPAHFAAANRRLAEIERDARLRIADLRRRWHPEQPGEALVGMAMVEREVDRARRAFGLFFEVFSQRGSGFAPALAAHDAIALDCYDAIHAAAPRVFRGPMLKPITYMEHGYSPATMRRGVTLGRLLGERNPFPLIRIPWDRDNPWQSVFLHEVSHNLQADLGLWRENKDAVVQRMLRDGADRFVGSVYTRWHKEIFADLAAALLGGPASVWGMMDFLAHPAPKTMTYKPGGAHPTGYLRVYILAEMLERMGFGADAARVRRVWTDIYPGRRGHRIPPRLLSASAKTIPAVVDEIAFQARRGLAERALADVIPFRREDEQRIRAAAAALGRDRVPTDLPPRFLVSASRYALTAGAAPGRLSRGVIRHLADLARRRQATSPGNPGTSVSGTSIPGARA